MEGKSIMKNRHQQLYVAVQDLLVELGITPEKLRDIAANRSHGLIKPIVTPNTAQKLIDANLIIEQTNWRRPGKVLVSNKDNEISEIDTPSSEDVILSTFNKIKSGLPPGILWSHLQENHSDFIYEQIKDYLFPGY